MFLTNLVLIALTQVGAPSGTVTYSNPAARMERLLPELSSAIGLKLVPGARMADVVLTLRLKNASINETLANISQATRGVWVKDGEALRLVENAGAIAKEQQAAEVRHTAGIHAMFAELHKAIEPKPPKETGDDGNEPVRPEEVAIAKLLPYLDEDTIAGLNVFERVVFSTKPRPLQRPLPGSTERFFEEMVDAEKRESSRLAAKDLESDGTRRAIKGVPYKTDVVVSREPKHSADVFRFSVYVYDSNGRVVTQDRVAGWIPDPEDPPVYGSRNTDRDEDAPKANALTIPPLMRKRLKLNEATVVPPEVRQIISKPLEHDPLEPLGAVLASYAELKNVQLVACISDWLQSLEAFDDDQSLTVRQVDRFLSRYSREPKNGWLTIQRSIKLADSVNDQSGMVDRHDLQIAVKKLRDIRCPELVELVQAIRDGLPLTEDLEQQALFPNIERTDGGVCALLAKVEDSQIAGLLAGKRLPFSQTSAAFQTAIATETFDSSEILIEIADSGGTSADRDYRSEPTEVVDSRAMPGAYVQLFKTDDVGLEPSSTTSYDEPRHLFYNLSMLASRINYGEDVATKFRFGVEHNYELRIYIAPQTYFSESSTLMRLRRMPPISREQSSRQMSSVSLRILSKAWKTKPT